MPRKIEWEPIEKASKSIPKGMMRVYSYAPVPTDRYGRNALPRATSCNSSMGSRKCDMVIDIPAPTAGSTQENEG